MEYDPLLAKLAVWADTREHATTRMIRALSEYDVGGIRTNLAFFRQILEDPDFCAGNLHTGFIDEFFQRQRPAGPPANLAAVAALAAALHTAARKPAAANGTARGASPWLTAGRDGLLR
jgi:acetyl-CoA carboxylase biotin carboxylase subunit